MFLRDSQVSWTSKLLSGWHPPSKTPTLGIEGILKGLMTFWRDKSLNNKSCSYYFVLFQSSKINLFRCESGRSKSYICLKWPLVFPFMHIVKPESKVPKSRPKGLGLTLKSHGPPPHHPTPPHTITFKHEGVLCCKSANSKRGSEWPPWLIQPKKLTRWTSRSRTWGSPTCSRRSLSINPNF